MAILKIKTEENNWVDMPSFESAEFTVEDTLDSTSATNALSANQGLNLSNQITDLKEEVNNHSSALDTIYIGGQVIYPNLSGTGNVDKTPLLGAYYQNLIQGIFYNVTIPEGYSKKYRLTAQITTGGANYLKLYLNSTQMISGNTYSNKSFRVVYSSVFFTEDDIGTETTYNYSTEGINLYYEVTGSSATWEFWNVTIHGYLVRD